MQCNGDCFNCKFKDCVATYQEISKLETAERKKRKEEMGKFLENMEDEFRERKNISKPKTKRERAKRAK